MTDSLNDRQLLAQLTNEDGDVTGAPFELPANVTPKQLQMLANAVLEHVHLIACVLFAAVLTSDCSGPR